jgi:hypothetical protein
MLSGSKNNKLKQEYCKITDLEKVSSSAQQTLNLIIDYNREKYKNLTDEEIESDKNLIDEISSINLRTFLSRKKKMFTLCILKLVNDSGITTLADLVQADEHERERNLSKSIKLVLSSIPRHLIEIAKNYNENINDDSECLKYVQITPSERMAIETITVKQLQLTLKVVLNRIESTNFTERLGIDDFERGDILSFRKSCTNSKLRNIHFRLINRDFFTHSRMKKYKMTQTDQCPRCGQIESINHLLWECPHVKQVWNSFNSFMRKMGDEKEEVKSYNNVYKFGQKSVTTLIKIKVIQALIQIERPKNWNEDRMEALVKDLIINSKIYCRKKVLFRKILNKMESRGVINK